AERESMYPQSENRVQWFESPTYFLTTLSFVRVDTFRESLPFTDLPLWFRLIEISSRPAD
ncbi:hypothetical protein COLO4_01586, partial [Corchorus olitorius]